MDSEKWGEGLKKKQGLDEVQSYFDDYFTGPMNHAHFDFMLIFQADVLIVNSVCQKVSTFSNNAYVNAVFQSHIELRI